MEFIKIFLSVLQYKKTDMKNLNSRASSLFLILCLFYACKTSTTVVEEDASMETDFDFAQEYEESSLNGYDYEDNEELGVFRKHASREIKHRLKHTKLEISFDWAKAHLIGKATLTLAPYFYSQDMLTLDAKGMDIHSVKMNGMDCAFVYLDSLKLQINLDKEYQKDQDYTVVIEYVSKPNERKTSGSRAITSDKGLYFINPLGEDKNKMPQIWTQGETESSSVWFPTIDAPNSKTTQEIYLTVEDKYKTLSNGVLKSSTKDKNGLRTDYWLQTKPHAPYLFMLAVGEFEVIKDEYKRNDGSKMEVNYYVEPEYAQDAQAIFGETPEMIRYFSDLLGVEYEWDKYSQIVVRDYVSGAMENTGAVIFGDYVYKNKRELIDENDQSTIAHELFHHWFGDLVTCESWSNLPLNESFANYSQYLWDEHRYGKDEADYMAEIEAQGYYASSSRQGYHDLIWYEYQDKEEMFDAHSYNKGGRILHMLRNHLGDKAFFQGLKNYLQTNKFKAAEFNQLRLAFEEVSGQDLNWFFDQWFLGKGHPVLFVDYKLTSNSETIVLTVKQMQNKSFSTFRIPLRVGIWDESGYKTHLITLDDEMQEFVLPVKGELKNILFDVDQMILGRVYEDKPMSFFFNQLKAKESKYRARITALNRLRGSEFFHEALKIALKDPYWNIRKQAINYIDLEYQNVFSKNIDPLGKLVVELLSTEKHSKVRAQGIELITKINPSEKDFERNLHDLALENGSYLVQGAALRGLLGSDSFNSVIDSLLQRKDDSETLLISDVLAQSGNDTYYETLKQLAQGEGKSMNEFRTFVSFMIFVTQAQERQDHYDWIVELFDLYEKRSEDPTGMFTMYGWRINMFFQNFLQGVLEGINIQISNVNVENRSELIERKEGYEKLLERFVK